ncbi:hypothetical protein D3C72_1839050 [compost metagenome]
MARQAHAAHHVDLEDLLPVGVANREEVLGAVDPQIVDQDVGRRLGGDQRLATCSAAKVGDHAAGQSAGLGGAQGSQCRIDTALLAAADDHAGTGVGESLSDGQADATGGAGDDGGLAGKIDDHERTPVVSDR